MRNLSNPPPSSPTWPSFKLSKNQNCVKDRFWVLEPLELFTKVYGFQTTVIRSSAIPSRFPWPSSNSMKRLILLNVNKSWMKPT